MFVAPMPTGTAPAALLNSGRRERSTRPDNGRLATFYRQVPPTEGEALAGIDATNMSVLRRERQPQKDLYAAHIGWLRSVLSN